MKRLQKKYPTVFKTIISIIFICLPILTFAQGDTPADGCDPYDGCQVPLDTWVILLAGTALIYAIIRLNKNQKQLANYR